MAVVYWIHLPEHDDPFTQGYIGVTIKSPKDRYKEHQSYARNKGDYPISKAILKYGDKLVIDTLVNASEEYCYEVESKLRPSPRIGWNLIIGGSKPPSRKGYKHTEEALRKISEASKIFNKSEKKKLLNQKQKGVKRSEESKQRMREAISKRDKSPWLANRAVPDVWSQADKLYDCWIENGKPGAINLGKYFRINCNLEVLVNYFRKEWVPSQDEKWLQWASKI